MSPQRGASTGSRPVLGALSLVLHAHLPYVRHGDDPDFLEEDWLYEAIFETYVPLLDLFDRLTDEAVPFRLAMTLSPSLCEMLADPLLADRASAAAGARVELAERVERRTRGTDLHDAARAQAIALRERWYLYEERYQRRLLPAFRRHAEGGSLEILGCAATHAVLPLLGSDQARRAQLLAGKACHIKHFGQPAQGIWLPECAFAPGLDELVADAGLRWFVVEADGLLRAEPPAYYGTGRPVVTPAGVAVFGRDAESSARVWSSQTGYPGDPWYRELYRDVGYDLPLDEVRPFLHRDGVRRNLGVKLHRITGAVGLGEKRPYAPAAAEARADEHAADFVAGRLEAAARLGEAFGFPPHLTSPYDAELFGHWWWEGPRFLERLLRRLAAEPALALVTPSEHLSAHPVHQELTPARSTWGEGADYRVWSNPRNDWIYPRLHLAEARMVALARRHVGGPHAAALAQLGRELLLAESSDWAFILSMGTSTGYAEQRIAAHLGRFDALADGLERGAVDPGELARAWAASPFLPELDPRIWAPQDAWPEPLPPGPGRSWLDFE